MASVVNMGSSLYAGKPQQILSLGAGSSKMTNSLGASYMGLSNTRPSNAQKQAKYGYQSLLLDELLINNSINAMEGSDATGKAVIYMEYKKGSTIYCAVCDGKVIRWKDRIPNTNSTKIMPALLYALSNNTNTTHDLSEAKKAFADCINDYKSVANIVSLPNMLLFNDSVYYGYFKGLEMTEYDDLDINEITRSASTGLLRPMDILSNVPNLPSMSVSANIIKPNVSTQNTSNEYEMFEKCQRGEYIISYPWTDAQRNKIPNLSVLNSYIPCDDFYSVVRKIAFRINRVLARIDANLTGPEAIGNDYINAFIVGRPGTGKTTLAYMAASATGFPIATVNVDKNTDDNEFEGKTKIVKGNFDFVTTEFLDAYENGGIIVLEEVNLADPNVMMGSLGQAIEFPFKLKKNGYQEIRRHPLCIIINTMNVGTEGTRPVSEPYSDRSKQTYVLNETTKEDFIKILMSKGYEKKPCEWVYDAYIKINNYLKSSKINREDLLLKIGIRNAIGALQNIEEGEPPKRALKNSIVGKIAEVDLDMYEEILKNVVDATIPETF